MGTSTSTNEFLVKQNLSTYTSQNVFNVYLLQNKKDLFVIQVRSPVNYLPKTYFFEPPLFKTDLQTKNHNRP